MPNASECQGVTKAGRPCQATPQRGRPWCVSHDPDREAERQAWSQRGGHNKANRIRAQRAYAEVMTMMDVAGLLSATLRQIAAGEVEPAQAAATATVARALIAVTDAAAFEDRLAALESRVGLNPGNVTQIERRSA